MKVSLIITTYNWPEALELVLDSVCEQSIIPNEVIVADDGSDFKTKQIIDNYKKRLNIIHIWHEDNGFRKSKILNAAILKCKNDYIVQVDGDVILHKKFIKDHIKNSKKGQYLFGSRVSLSKELSSKVLICRKIPSLFFKKIKRRGRLIRIPFLTRFYKPKDINSKKLRGCNLSYWKKDAFKINGYNEEFEGWGFEDFEFVQRLLNANVLSKRLKFGAIQYHIYHKQAQRGNTSKGNEVLINTIKNKIISIPNGIIKDKITSL